MTTSRQVEEVTSFPLDLNEERFSMMVDKPQTYEEPSLTHVIKGVLDELEVEGTMLVEASEEVA